MNRRLIREVYHREALVAEFTQGVPAWLEEVTSDTSTITAKDYTDAYGSHVELYPKGASAAQAVLLGPALAVDHLAAVVVRAEGVSLEGDSQVLLGLRGSPGATQEIVASLYSGESTNSARARISIGNGTNYQVADVWPARGSATAGVTTELEIEVAIDVRGKQAEAAFDGFWGRGNPMHWPTGKVLRPALWAYATSVAGGYVRARRVTWEIYR